jgi:hypothetical protein
VAATGGTGISITGSPITTSGTITITNSAPDQVVALTASTGISVTGTYPNFTITNTSPSSGGTVTSVAALTIGTSGTDLSSSVANSTTTPVITLNVPTASAANRGALSSADWSTFNSKQGTITLTTTGTSGAATFSANTLNIPNYTITNAVTGTGTTNYLPKFTGASTIGNSQVFDNGTNVGISTATLVDRLTIYGGIALTQIGAEYIYSNGGSGGAVNAGFQFDGTNNTIKAFTNNTTKMTLNSTGNLGLGVTPSAWYSTGYNIKALQIGSAGALFNLDVTSSNLRLYLSNNAYVESVSAAQTYIVTGAASQFSQENGAFFFRQAASGTANNPITFTTAMTLDSSGNLGLGVTPSAWNSSYKAFQFGSTGVLWANATAANGDWYLGNNNYYSTGGQLLYLTNGKATEYFQYDGMHVWETAGTGTAGGLVTFAQAMRLFSTGNLCVGTSATDSGYKLDVNGTGRFSGQLTGANAAFSANVSGDVAVEIVNTNTTNGYGLKVQGGVGSTSYALNVVNAANTIDLFSVMGSGAATFSSSVTATSFFESSDSRLKTLIQDNYQTKGIASITPKLYTKNGKVELGYYAQDFVGILDSAVSKGSDDMLSLSYREVLVAKVYALEQRIKELENK